jgi:hypothetical protein
MSRTMTGFLQLKDSHTTVLELEESITFKVESSDTINNVKDDEGIPPA